MKLGRTGQTVLAALATFTLAAPMIATGVATGAEGWSRSSIAATQGQAAAAFPVASLGSANTEDEADPVLPTEAAPTPTPDIPRPENPTDAGGSGGSIPPAPVEIPPPPPADEPVEPPVEGPTDPSPSEPVEP